MTVPLAFGLLMSPWAGHSVFPSIYRDMRHGYKYPKALRVTFCFTVSRQPPPSLCTHAHTHTHTRPEHLTHVTGAGQYLLDATTAVAGLLMFGDAVGDEITSNILQTSGYPQTLKISMCIFIAIIPLTKTPLNARPITTMLEALLGLQKRNDPPHAPQVTLRSIARAAVAVASLLCFTVVAVIFPSFDSVMAFMGSALSFTICVT